jgi:hypothetical protein
VFVIDQDFRWTNVHSFAWVIIFVDVITHHRQGLTSFGTCGAVWQKGADDVVTWMNRLVIPCDEKTYVLALTLYCTIADGVHG